MVNRKGGKQRSVKQRILLLCEGKTEQLYLSGFKNALTREMQRDLDIQIVQSKKSDLKASIDIAINKRKEAKKQGQPFKEIWMVFDDDNRNLQSSFTELKKEEINIAYSSISLEYWFILHFEQTGKHFLKPEDAYTRLLKFKPEYDKTNPYLWQEFESNYTEATKNANLLRNQKENCEMYDSHRCKPFTNIDVLIERIKNYDND